jgi:hypothetical protein
MMFLLAVVNETKLASRCIGRLRTKDYDSAQALKGPTTHANRKTSSGPQAAFDLRRVPIISDVPLSAKLTMKVKALAKRPRTLKNYISAHFLLHYPL